MSKVAGRPLRLNQERAARHDSRVGKRQLATEINYEGACTAASYISADAAICKPTQHASIVPADRVDDSKELQPLCMLGWASLSESQLLEQNYCHES